jgi:hypothetical protein
MVTSAHEFENFTMSPVMRRLLGAGTPQEQSNRPIQLAFAPPSVHQKIAPAKTPQSTVPDLTFPSQKTTTPHQSDMPTRRNIVTYTPGC